MKPVSSWKLETSSTLLSYTHRDQVEAVINPGVYASSVEQHAVWQKSRTTNRPPPLATAHSLDTIAADMLLYNTAGGRKSRQEKRRPANVKGMRASEREREKIKVKVAYLKMNLAVVVHPADDHVDALAAVVAHEAEADVAWCHHLQLERHVVFAGCPEHQEIVVQDGAVLPLDTVTALDAQEQSQAKAHS